MVRKNASGRVMAPGRPGIVVTERGESVGEIRRKDLQGAREARNFHFELDNPPQGAVRPA